MKRKEGRGATLVLLEKVAVGEKRGSGGFLVDGIESGSFRRSALGAR